MGKKMCNQTSFIFIIFIAGTVVCRDQNELEKDFMDEKRRDLLHPVSLRSKASTANAKKICPDITSLHYDIFNLLNGRNQRSGCNSSNEANSRRKRQLINFREISENYFTCSLPSMGLDSDMSGVMTDVIKTLVVTHLHLVFMSEPDHCLLNTLWDEGVILELLDSQSWWIRLKTIDYLSHTQHVLVGSLDWIIMTMEKVKLLYNNSSMNAFNTRWIWVPTSWKPSDSDSSVSSTERTSFGNILKEVTKSLQEGMRGVVIFEERTNLNLSSNEVSNAFQHKRSVKVGSIMAPGDGSWVLQGASRWLDGNLDMFRPLWPRPSFNLQNRTIRVTCLQKPTVFEYKKGGGLDDAVGYASNLMLIARHHLNFSDILVPSDGFGNKGSNGNWNGMVGVLHRKEADIAPLDFTPSYARSQVVDFGKPIGEDIILILSKAPAEIIRPFLLLQIFSLQVWACIVLSALALGVILEIFVKIESNLSNSSVLKPGTIQQIENSLKIFVYQGSTNWPVEDGGRLIAICGILVALIVGSLYTGSITAFFAIPFRTKPIDSVDDLLRSPVRLAIRSKTNTYSTMVQNENGILYEGRARVSLFSGNEIGTWDFFQFVADGTFALVDVYSSAVGRANSFESRNEKCKFYLGRQAVRTDADVFAFMKNSPIFYQFDKTMQWLRYFGIIEHIKRKYYSTACETKTSSNAIKPMSVIQVQGSFYLLGMGLSLGFFIFLVEIIWLKIMRFPNFLN